MRRFSLQIENLFVITNFNRVLTQKILKSDMRSLTLFYAHSTLQAFPFLLSPFPIFYWLSSTSCVFVVATDCVLVAGIAVFPSVYYSFHPLRQSSSPHSLLTHLSLHLRVSCQASVGHGAAESKKFLIYSHNPFLHFKLLLEKCWT